jgi:acetylornithine/N-succinyldiaminopimelate aminotransferase
VKNSGKTAAEIKEIADKYIMFSKQFDFICDHAEGVYMYDENGRAYLDFFGGIAVNSAGNANPKVVEAIREQAGDAVHISNYPYITAQALLAEKICATIGFDKIFFQNSGAEANEAMIKLARKYGADNYGAEKYYIITALNSFHGRTYGALSATGQPGGALHRGFAPLLPGFSYAEFNNLDSFREQVTENTIAIMIEPVQGESGVYPATDEFIRGLRELCDEKGLLLLFDEVQTGWCRTGDIMGFMSYGVRPDIVSMAKAMGGGMPIAAVCADSGIAAAFTAGSHGTTFGGNPVCCAAALAQIDELLSRNLAQNAREAGDYFAAKLKTLPHVREVRHRGLMVGVEFDAPLAHAVKLGCFAGGLLITEINASSVRMVPPLIVSSEDCDKAFGIIKNTLKNK